MRRILFFVFVVIMTCSLYANQNFTGDGGKGISLTVLVPDSHGLTQAESYLPSMIQGVLVGDLTKYSAISVLDRLNLEAVLIETESGIYKNDEDFMQLGKITNTDYTLTGRVSKTSAGFALQIQIISNTNGNTRASHSSILTRSDIDNFIGVRKVSLDLLTKIGVVLTDNAKKELSGPEVPKQIIAQKPLAQGITAQKQGTEITALTYYFQAMADDPNLQEAINRSTILSANIASGKMGEDIRNDVAWRKQWVDRLIEIEQLVNNMNRSGATPFTLYYSDELKQESINYQNNTVSFSIDTILTCDVSETSAIIKVLNDIYTGLVSTGRAQEWGLSEWPIKNITNDASFKRQNKKFNIIFEILNEKNKVITKQSLHADTYWLIDFNDSNEIFKLIFGQHYQNIIFQNIKIEEITDKLTIKVASVNGYDSAIASKNGILQIATSVFGDSSYDFNIINGEIIGFIGNKLKEAEKIKSFG